MSRAVRFEPFLLVFVLLGASASGCFGCSDPPPKDGQVATVASGWYRGDFHFHTNHSDDAREQGGDDLKEALEIADSWTLPEYVALFPERANSGLDFVVVTDHRTDAPLRDPDFKHDRLIVIGGEEYGGRGHATIAGLKQHIPHDPVAGESQDQRHADNFAAAHAQGAIFSINHPVQDNFWPWTVEGIDGVEVWNAPWSAFWGETDEEALDGHLAGNPGAENPYIRGAMQHRGGGTNEQGLWLWYGMLTRGHHPAFIGGSDHHMLLMPGHPTIYVRKPDDPAFEGKTGKALGPDGIVAGVKAGGTFVSRNPYAAQVVLEAEDASGKRFPLGAKLKAPGTYKVHAKVGRAAKGLLKFVGGDVVAGTGPVKATPVTKAEFPIELNFQEFTYTWEVPAGGAWLHALVYEQRLPKELEPPLQPALQTLNKLPEGKSITAMLEVMGPLVDVNALQDPTKCDVADWEAWSALCLPVDKKTLGTFYLPDSVDRLLNTVFVDGVATEWTMGAITSAFLATPAPK